jgi:hypothetical protein
VVPKATRRGFAAWPTFSSVAAADKDAEQTAIFAAYEKEIVK